MILEVPSNPVFHRSVIEYLTKQGLLEEEASAHSLTTFYMNNRQAEDVESSAQKREGAS